MADLLKFQAKICSTATAFLIHHHKILLVHHQKLGIWLAPGGHVEPGELPHLTAERECQEETGISVQAISATPALTGTTSQYLPIPFVVNLHWISQSNYHARLSSAEPDKPHATTTWPKGCEQHVVFCYLVKPIGALKLTPNLTETTGVQWFTESEIDSLETSADIKAEIHLAFSL